MRQEGLVNLIKQDKRFLNIAQEFSGEASTLTDAEFLVREDGIIFNVEGYHHPKNQVVGEVLYAPDENGDKSVFGQRYRKVTLRTGTHEPIAYPDRGKALREIDPRLDQGEANPYFARYKQILPCADFIAHLSSPRGLASALEQSGASHEKFQRNFENLMILLGLNPDEITLGVTGSLLLGNTREFHDLDIVFRGGLKENIELAKNMRNLALQEPHRRVFEGGKSWQIRFYNDLGVLMCNFFTYFNKQNAPLRDFGMTIIEPDVQLAGTVADDTHSVYTPTVLGLKDVAIHGGRGLIERFTDLPLVVYHTASRGDCFKEDVVCAKGSLVEITPAHADPYLAFCVIDREGLRNETPPWKGYYAE